VRAGFVLTLVLALFAGACRKTAEIGRVESRLTLARDDGGHLAWVERSASPDVYYRVALAEAPVGAELELTCEWIDPSGRVVHQNRYRTLTIDKPVWPTHCHHLIGPAAPAGRWTVRLSVEGRALDALCFEVR
jgi:hypothetical protein